MRLSCILQIPQSKQSRTSPTEQTPFLAVRCLCYPPSNQAKQMRHIWLHSVALNPRFPRAAALVLPSATRPRLFAGD